MSRVIALDLGTKSCGFAITDPMQIIAQPLENFRFELNNFAAVITKLQEYQQEYVISTIVLGYPKRMTGTKSERTLMVEKFKKILELNFALPVILVDERLTTKKANEIMRSAGLSIQKRKAKKDKMAAQLILQSYLDGGS